ncbi:MAG: ABC transporter ATP-binding protein [Gammaproteobacteria bacterium]|nr:MAG: ABC transporter ATP-binding protein [Gammaproteobacteria bacterium]
MININIQEKSWPATERTAKQSVIKNLKFSLESGEFICMVGPSGCGKSTLLNLLAGLDSDFEGQIQLESKSKNYSPHIGYVFQNPRLLPWRTVRENIDLALPEPLPEQSSVVVDNLIEVMGLTGAQHKYPEMLSLGMSRRVALVRAFAIQPDFLLMDEPFVSLDAPTARKVQKLLIDVWKKRPHTVLFVTHDLNEAILLADRILFLAPSPTKIIADIKIDISRESRDEEKIDRFKKKLFEENEEIRMLL